MSTTENQFPIKQENALAARELISDFFANYSYGESLDQVFNVFAKLHLITGSREHELSNMLDFAKKLSSLFLAAKYLHEDKNWQDELNNYNDANAKIALLRSKLSIKNKPIREMKTMMQVKKETLQVQSILDKAALDTVFDNFLPETELNNFFYKYGLYDSHQLCYGLLCASSYIEGMTRKHLDELEMFEDDLKTLLNACYLRFRKQQYQREKLINNIKGRKYDFADAN